MNKKRIASFIKAIALSRKPGIGAAKFKEILNQYDQKIDLAFKAIINQSLVALYPDKTQFDLKDISQKIAQGICDETTWYGDKKYPDKLRDMTEPPPILFLKGNLEHLFSDYSYAIVGSRDCSQTARTWVRQLVNKCHDKSICIISGMAEGVDFEAHTTALKNEMPTVGVIATGIDIKFPKKNESVYEQMYEQGLICTEFLPNAQPRPSFFPTRNRIIAGLSDAVIVVEASIKSGALYTAKNAFKQGKPIFVPPEKIMAKLTHTAGLELLIKKYNAKPIQSL